MSSGKLSERKLKEIEEVAAGCGKLLAQEAFPNGPGLDVTLADMEGQTKVTGTKSRQDRWF